MCAKNAMLLLDGISGKDGVINTGVIGGNKKSISELKFKTSTLYLFFNSSKDKEL